MWICPKCKRDFKNEGQSHYCLKVTDIDGYIESQAPEIQPILNELRNLIRAALSEAAPEAKEKIAWNMPYFAHKGENLVGFAAQKKHISFFPGAAAAEHFAQLLESKDYKCNKATIQLPLDKPLDGELITDIVKWRLKQCK
jgi:uncharacterized protein YdhG (YjbR/CyaY superfamily)